MRLPPMGIAHPRHDGPTHGLADKKVFASLDEIAVDPVIEAGWIARPP
jgi:hypothetical protein